MNCISRQQKMELKQTSELFEIFIKTPNWEQLPNSKVLFCYVFIQFFISSRLSLYLDQEQIYGKSRMGKNPDPRKC